MKVLLVLSLGRRFLIQFFWNLTDKYPKGLRHSKHVYGWAQAFFRIKDPKKSEKVFYIVFRKLEEVESIACTIQGQS